jgi:hypothetical protein
LQRLIKEIERELLKDKKFRDELSVTLVNDYLDLDKDDISLNDVKKKTKELLKTLVKLELALLEPNKKNLEN